MLSMCLRLKQFVKELSSQAINSTFGYHLSHLIKQKCKILTISGFWTVGWKENISRCKTLGSFTIFFFFDISKHKQLIN